MELSSTLLAHSINLSHIKDTYEMSDWKGEIQAKDTFSLKAYFLYFMAREGMHMSVCAHVCVHACVLDLWFYDL